jgi:5'-phosphate synthase pdxT subunit
MSQILPSSKIIGILALQGDFEAHRTMLEDRLQVRTAEVRAPKDLARVDGLVLPGGESTTIAKLLNRIELAQPIRERVRAGMPVFGTCAGMILLAKEIADRPDQPTLDLIDITVERNAFGRQVDSFETEISFGTKGEEQEVRGVFIRAPYVTRLGRGVEPLAALESKVVAVRQGNLLATAFHPELTDNTGVHSLFLRMVAEA